MVESADEIPISYLNKGQVYDITVMDLRPPMITPEPLQYRTFIRISFDIEEQRLNPAACWQMWEDSRGMSEAQQRGSEPLAIEFVPGLLSRAVAPKAAVFPYNSIFCPPILVTLKVSEVFRFDFARRLNFCH